MALWQPVTELEGKGLEPEQSSLSDSGVLHLASEDLERTPILVQRCTGHVCTQRSDGKHSQGSGKEITLSPPFLACSL